MSETKENIVVSSCPHCREILKIVDGKIERCKEREVAHRTYHTTYWTKELDDLLKEFYGKAHIRIIIKLIYDRFKIVKTKQAVYNRARMLGITNKPQEVKFEEYRQKFADKETLNPLKLE